MPSDRIRKFTVVVGKPGSSWETPARNPEGALDQQQKVQVWRPKSARSANLCANISSFKFDLAPPLSNVCSVRARKDRMTSSSNFYAQTSTMSSIGPIVVLEWGQVCVLNLLMVAELLVESDIDFLIGNDEICIWERILCTWQRNNIIELIWIWDGASDIFNAPRKSLNKKKLDRAFSLRKGMS